MKQEANLITAQREMNSYHFLRAWRQYCQDCSFDLLNGVNDIIDNQGAYGIIPPKTRFSTEPLKVGQIRLLSGTNENLEVLLYKKQGRTWTVIPLSPFEFPASELELTFHDDITILKPVPFERTSRTYCLWSFFEYPENVLEQRSWIMGEVSINELMQLKEALLHFYANDVISDSVLKKTGTPILLPFDERLEYEEQITQTVQQACLASKVISIILRVQKSLKHQICKADAVSTVGLVDATLKSAIQCACYAAAEIKEFHTPLIFDELTSEGLAFVAPGIEDIQIQKGKPLLKLVWKIPPSILEQLTNARILLVAPTHEQILGECELENIDSKRPTLKFMPLPSQISTATICVKDLCLYVEK